MITLVTGNAGKLAEWRRLVPAGFDIQMKALELDELQTLDTEALIADKARRAYAVIGSPVIVEDISAGLVRLGGLPGPFMKFFEQTLGDGALYELAREPDEPAIVRCIIGYFDGQELTIISAETKGTIIAPRGSYGFGFDKVFRPDGHSKTYGEMMPAEKDAISYRGAAIRQLLEKLPVTTKSPE